MVNTSSIASSIDYRSVEASDIADECSSLVWIQTVSRYQLKIDNENRIHGIIAAIVPSDIERCHLSEDVRYVLIHSWSCLSNGAE